MPVSDVKLFMFAHAGGSAVVYWRWKRYLEAGIQICPVELPGRGKLVSVPLCRSIDDAVDAVYPLIMGKCAESPYAFFGHSMGCIVAYEMTRRIRLAGRPGPEHVFFSALCPPHTREGKHNVSHLSDKRFLAHISEYGGVPPEILELKEMTDLFLPILRADYRMLEAYMVKGEGEKLNVPVSVFRGMDDRTTPRHSMAEWALYTDKECTSVDFAGGHFYFNAEEPLRKLTAYINGALTRRPAYV